MTKKGTNPFKQDELKKKDQEPAVEPDETLHSSDIVDDDLSDEIDELETAEESSADSALQKQLHAAHDQLMRAKAEVENARRRAEHDVARAHKYALEKFINELLPVLDSLEQALQNASEEDPIREGVELTLKLFLDVVKKFGVEQVDPINEKFNPEHHEAMSMQPSKEAEANTVLMVVQKGYVLNNRLVRPARVIVAK